MQFALMLLHDVGHLIGILGLGSPTKSAEKHKGKKRISFLLGFGIISFLVGFGIINFRTVSHSICKSIYFGIGLELDSE